MEENKKLLNKTKKVVLIISIACVILIIAAIASIVFIKNSLIGKRKSEEIALSDAGVQRSDVSDLHSELDFDDGHFQYDVDFYNNGTEYEYTIMAKNGDIISRDKDIGIVMIDPDEQNSSSKNDSKISEDSIISRIDQLDSEFTNEINEADAKSAAISDAGLDESEVNFIRVEIDNDDFIKVYEVNFTDNKSQYIYKINAENGSVVEKSVRTVVERWPNPNNAPEEYIDVEKAKEIALNHAGFSNDEVRFSEAKLDNDNNIYDYEISFYKDNIEYDYTIDAVTGNIIEYDIDND